MREHDRGPHNSTNSFSGTPFSQPRLPSAQPLIKYTAGSSIRYSH